MRRRHILIALAAFAAAPLSGAFAEGEGGGKKAKPPYLQLKTVAVSIIRASGRRGVLTVEVGLDVPDSKLRDTIELYLPILYSAYVSALQPYGLGLAAAQDAVGLALEGHGDVVGVGRLPRRQAQAIGLQRRDIG